MKSATRLRAGSAVIAVVAGLAVAPWAQNAQATPFNYTHLNKIQKRLVSGALAYEMAPRTEASPRARVNGGDYEGSGADGLPDTPPASYATAGGSAAASNYVAQGTGECSVHYGSNVKVNQNCLNLSDRDLQGRSQANNETSIAQNPFDTKQMVASNNDYRRGDGTCGADYSADGGRTWQDSTVPNGFTRGFNTAREYWQAGGDTSVAWDTRGNAYLSCQLFNRGAGTSPNADESSSFVVFRSTGNGGASWNFPGRYVTANFAPNGASGALEDKQLLAVDNNVNSPYRDRVYVTWTDFTSDGTAYIYEAYSKDYGETFSAPVLVSSDSALCGNTYGLPTPNGKCNENQYSDPFVGPDGALYVVFSNFNNVVSGNDNRNQMLLAKSTDGGASFGAPVKVGDYYDLPDCYTYQGDDPGRGCVPEKGSSTKSVFRAVNYPSGSVNPQDPNEVSVTYGSYINKNSNESNGCVPTGFSQFGINTYSGVKTPGACNNDILVSTSHNGGASFSGTNTDPRQQTTVNQSRGQSTTDQFWQWSGYNPRGVFAVTYYDRQYGNDEYNGSSDLSLSTSRDMTRFDSTRVTTSSMPAPTEFYGSKGGLFYGDYIGLAVGKEAAYPIWSDTRNIDLFLCPNSATGPGNPPKVCTATESNGQRANDEDIYTARVPLTGEHAGNRHH